jgi:cytochrome P450
MARFSSGGCHTRRRVEVDRLLEGIDPAAVRSTAMEITERSIGPLPTLDAVADLGFRVPIETMLTALGVPGDHAVLMDDVRAVTAVIGRGMAASDSTDTATERLLDAGTRIGRNAVAMASLLYQTHDATAALVIETILARHRQTVRAAAVTQTRRMAVTDTVIGDAKILAGSIVVLDLAAAGLEFGAGPHQCPGRLVAEAIVDGIILAVDSAGFVVRDVSANLDDHGRPTSIMLGQRF